MDPATLDYHLPASAIAQIPAEPRDAARLLVDRGPGHRPDHARVADLAAHVAPGDVVVVNTTRVMPARLHLVKPTGGHVEVLLLAPDPPGQATTWEALVRPSRRVPPGAALRPADHHRRDARAAPTTPADRTGGDPVIVVEGAAGDAARRVRICDDDPRAFVDQYGTVPLPPYITGGVTDPDRYQTVYADRPTSVAAPTAGLHLTAELLGQLRGAGARVATVELDVGLGTFRPITAARVEDHEMHRERYRVPEATVAACEGSARVVAIGTTTVRALESAARTGELEGATDLFITGDDRVRSVDLLLTNFHQPRSTLLALIDAFVGPRWRALYDEALRVGYRFLSFGDAMLLRGERG